MREGNRVWSTYLKVADLSEATLSPEHALDIAEWVVRRSWRDRAHRVMLGHSRAAWQAQAIRERWAREERRYA